MHPDTAARGNMHNVANFIPRIVHLAFIVQIRPSFFFAVFTCSSRLIARCRISVGRVVNGFAPFVGLLGAGHFERDMLEPAVRRGSVPVLDVSRDVHRIALPEPTRRLAPFLVESLTRRDDEHLPAPL